MDGRQASEVERAARDVTARGVRMRVIEAGDERRPAVVLIHDFLCNHLEFDAIIDALALEFRVIVPDLPGFGASEKPSPRRYPYSVEAFAEAIADLIAAYELGQAHVLGVGLGGAVAMTLAAHYAELVDRLVLVGPHCYPTASKLRAPLLPLIGSVIFKQLYSHRVFRNHFRSNILSIWNDEQSERIDHYYAHFNTPGARESAYAILQNMIDTRAIVARITRIRCQTLIAWGSDDRIIPPTLASKLVREMSDARLELFDTGHTPHAERPERFVRIVEDFFRGRRS
jgi:pimeloyl-ACP methyl ester carboxylesterase